MLKLTKEDEEYLRDNLRYDPETGELWWTKPFSHRRLYRPVGSKHNQGYLVMGIKLPSCVRSLLCHRVAWFLYYGSWPNDMLDHINGDRDDNRITNIRLANRQQNNRNKKSKSDSSSKYKGVSWHNHNKTWHSRIQTSGEKINLGHYTSEEDAARAYDKAAREAFGDYARLNFPEEHEQGATHGHDL